MSGTYEYSICITSRFKYQILQRTNLFIGAHRGFQISRESRRTSVKPTENMHCNACLQHEALIYQTSHWECHNEVDLLRTGSFDYYWWWLDGCEGREVFGLIHKTDKRTHHCDEITTKQRLTRSTKYRYSDSTRIECRFHCKNGCWRYKRAWTIRDANEFLQAESKYWHPWLKRAHFQWLNVHSLKWQNNKLSYTGQTYKVQSTLQLLSRSSNYYV